MRRRDFDSQITALPGPKTIVSRKEENQSTRGVKKYELRQRDNQAFVSDIDDKFNAHRVDPKVFPNHRKTELPLDNSKTRKGYELKQFIMREKYDFLNPGKDSKGLSK